MRWGTVGLGMAAVAIAAGERAWPLRDRTQREPERSARNLVLGAMAMATVGAIEQPLVGAVARRVERRGWGVAQKLPLPAWARDAAAMLLLDYATYGWHVATHRVPALWRLHLVHHVDMDLDASTALRFHAADMAVSAPVRALQVLLAGASPRAVAVWRGWFFVSVLFHHSNLLLPERWERWLGAVVTTPRMHGIHHSTVRGETDSNWSSGFSVWDRLHGTFRANVEQEGIAIGVPGWRDPGEIGVAGSLMMPFTADRDAWTPRAGDLPVPVQPRPGGGPGGGTRGGRGGRSRRRWRSR